MPACGQELNAGLLSLGVCLSRTRAAGFDERGPLNCAVPEDSGHCLLRLRPGPLSRGRRVRAGGRLSLNGGFEESDACQVEHECVWEFCLCVVHGTAPPPL